MDKLAQQLITLELAIPGIYVAVLKLTAGDDATVAVNHWLFGALGCWFAALVLALISLIPRTWKVDPTILIYKAPDAPATPEVVTYTFPAVIPTQPPGDPQSPQVP